MCYALLCIPLIMTYPKGDGQVPTKAPKPNTGYIPPQARAATRAVHAPHLAKPPPKQPPTLVQQVVGTTMPVQQ